MVSHANEFFRLYLAAKAERAPKKRRMMMKEQAEEGLRAEHMLKPEAVPALKRFLLDKGLACDKFGRDYIQAIHSAFAHAFIVL